MTDRDRPSCIAHWAEVEKPEEGHYRGDDELMGFGAPLARHFGLTRLGIHHERLPPGRRTSFPHAETKFAGVAPLPLSSLALLSVCNERLGQRLNTLRKKGRSGGITTTSQKEVGPGIRREHKIACIS